MALVIQPQVRRHQQATSVYDRLLACSLGPGTGLQDECGGRKPLQANNLSYTDSLHNRDRTRTRDTHRFITHHHPQLIRDR